MLTGCPAVHAALLAAAALIFFRVKSLLDASYAASNHPVDYATGQTAFSGAAIKGYYAHMLERGTLDIYWQTQMIDFGFIASLASFGLLAGSLLARLSANGGWAWKMGSAAAFLIVGGAAFDVMENLISFIMLSNPSGFADWLALPYSGSAGVKFALITAGMFAATVSVMLNIYERLWRSKS